MALAAAALTVAGICVAAPPSAGQGGPPPNPALPERSCGLRVVLVVDTSRSIIDAGAENPDIVRSAAQTILQTLRASPSTATVISFRRNAVTELPASGLDDEAGFRRAVQAIDGIQFDGSGFGATAGTNWEAALRAARRAPQPPGEPVDLVVFLTDGNPNRYGTDLDRAPSSESNDFDPRALAAGVAEAEILRRGGTRVVAVGVGDVRTEALQAVSGPVRGEDWFVGDFDALTATLARVGTALCGSRVVAQADVDRAPLGGLAFRLLGGATRVADRTGADGAVVLRPRIAQGGQAELTLIAGSTREGIQLDRVQCNRNETPFDATVDRRRSTVDFELRAGEIVTCSFAYERDPVIADTPALTGRPPPGGRSAAPIGAVARLLDDLSATVEQVTKKCRRDRDNRNGFGRTFQWALRNDLENCINDTFMRDVAARLAGLDPGRFALPTGFVEGPSERRIPGAIVGTSGWKADLVDRDGRDVDDERKPARHFIGWLAAGYFHPRSANTGLSCAEYERGDHEPASTGQDVRSGRLAVDLGIKLRRGSLSLAELLQRIEDAISDPTNSGQDVIIDEPSPARVPRALQVIC